ncbi:zinc finger protein 846-like [Aricia agestis]|uniref:zinc finger protein 846-like n=1 Tax=Aricia agestis TaxID=91739 RepID=UPI001C202A64|nr:zinc finger protein 846-like [Aricia agestis]
MRRIINFKMNQGTCLLCFSVAKVFNIKYTHLQNVYEELSGIEIQADPHPLCYICYTKLLQSQQLLKQIQENIRASQTDARPLIQLSMVENYAWSLPQNSAKIQLHPVTIKEENIKEEYVEGTAVEFVESPGRESKSPAIKEECAESPSHYEAESTGESAYEHIPTEPTQDDTKLYDYSKKEAKKDTTESSCNPEPQTKIEIKKFATMFICETCSKQFTSTKALKLHIRLHTEEKKFTCDVCSKKFFALYNLKRHVIIHSEKKHSCEVCNKLFTTPATLKRHRQVHTDPNQYTCEVCNKSFTTDIYLRTHMLIHTGEKPYVCSFCSKCFTTSTYLRTHIISHSEEKRYTCDVCNKKFARARYLKRHTLMHSGIKKYACDVCDKRFKLGCHLKMHKRTHTGEKPYNCDVCNKRYRTIYSLKNHKAKHERERPNFCDVCGVTHD